MHKFESQRDSLPMARAQLALKPFQGSMHRSQAAASSFKGKMMCEHPGAKGWITCLRHIMPQPGHGLSQQAGLILMPTAALHNDEGGGTGCLHSVQAVYGAQSAIWLLPELSPIGVTQASTVGLRGFYAQLHIHTCASAGEAEHMKLVKHDWSGDKGPSAWK